MSHKQSSKSKMQFEIKEISEAGTFEGLLSPYGNVDQGGDVVEPGAFTKTLKEGGLTRPLLWQHKTDVPIGEIALEERSDGLWCKGRLLMELPEAQKAYLLIKAKIVKGLSIGFETIKDAVEAGRRRLKELKLYEGSIVTFPMNEMALITAVKAKGKGIKGDFNENLNDIQLGDAFYQMRQAFGNALTDCLHSGMTKDEVISMSETCIQQFSEAYITFLPDYLAMMESYYGGMETWAAKINEIKAGRKISSANRDVIKAAAESLLALIAEEADGETSDTSEGKAAKPVEAQEAEAEEGKSEPEYDHSAIQSLIDEIRGLVPA